jgi:DNA-directed RNA polymerase subunit beta'
MFDINELAAMQVGLASPDTIRSWSHGEVTKPETINYRSQKPEMGGLFCEKIFGPAKDYECHCGKYKKIRYQGITCEKCGVEVISKEWRRERFGHIELVSPCSPYLVSEGHPFADGLVLDVSPKQLEEVIYFAAHIVLNPGTSTVLKYKDFLDERAARVEFVDAINALKPQIPEGSADALKADELIQKMQNPAETFDFFTNSAFISKYTGAEFGEGAAAIKRLLHEVDLDKEFERDREGSQGILGQRRLKLTKRLEVIRLSAIQQTEAGVDGSRRDPGDPARSPPDAPTRWRPFRRQRFQRSLSPGHFAQHPSQETHRHERPVRHLDERETYAAGSRRRFDRQRPPQ